MGVTCIVDACGKSKEKNKEITLHVIPKNESLRKQWIQAVSINSGLRDGLKNIDDRAVICSHHFDESSYQTSLLGKRVLIPGAIPNVFVARRTQKDSASLPKSPPTKKMKKAQQKSEVNQPKISSSNNQKRKKAEKSKAQTIPPEPSTTNRAASSPITINEKARNKPIPSSPQTGRK